MYEVSGSQRDSGAVTLRCRGHPSITGTHRKTLELTRDTEITTRATCVVGVGGDWDERALRRLRGRIRVHLEAGGHRHTFEADVSRSPSTTASLVFRRGPDLADRTFAYHATAGAAGIDRALVQHLGDTSSVLDVRIDQLDPAATGAGALFVVALPIGDHRDLSLRARQTIEQADVVLAEDTRRFRALAREAGIAFDELVSLREANEAARVPQVLDLLRAGRRVVLVSDAGSPVVSDPGLLLVREAVGDGARVVPVPGPSAPVTALMAAGQPADGFLFVGFLPRRRDQRRTRLSELVGHRGAVVLFEAPHRLEAALSDVAELLPGRELVVARELTKIHEELVYTTTSEAAVALAGREPRGEYTLVVGPAADQPRRDQVELDEPVARLVDELRSEVPTRTLADALSKATGMNRRAAYEIALGRGRRSE